MALKNYTSDWTADKSIAETTKILARNGANQILIEYRDGEAVGMSFVINVKGQMVPIRLPARVEKVAKVLENQGVYWKKPDQDKRTAWRNIHDWVAAQMALLETEMVTIEEIFLPYVTNQSGETLFEKMKDRQFLLPD